MLRGLNLNPTETELSEMMKDVDPNETGSFDQNSLISLVARKGKCNDTLEEMIEALKQFGESAGGDDREKTKITVDQFKYAMMNMGEKMQEHQVEEILTDSDLVHEEALMIEEFAKYLMSK